MEGPSLVILREELTPFVNQRVLEVSGNTKQPKELLKGRVLSKIETWGKVLFLTFSKPRAKNPDPVITKTHFLMFGSYRINDPKPNRDPRLKLKFKNGVVYFYSCSINFGGEEYLKLADHRVDLMSDKWDRGHVLELMEKKTDSYLCDLFLDQKIFAGSGNIVKNEVLFNIRRHPLTKLSAVSRRDWPKLADEVRKYCLNFYEWKKKFELRKHWQVYRKSKCPVCDTKVKIEKNGKLERKSFFCPNCQSLSARRASRLKVFDVMPIRGPKELERHFDH